MTTTLLQENWKPVVGYEGSYEVSDLGRVRSLDRAVLMKNRWGNVTEKSIKERILRLRPSSSLKKYLSVALGRGGNEKYFLVHRLVATAFLKNAEEKPCINHIDCDGGNNDVKNLEWVSYKENTQHGLVKGKVNKNRKGVPNIKPDILQKRAILSLFNTRRFSQRQIGHLLGITETTINSILRAKK